jgi:hypothetical protein
MLQWQNGNNAASLRPTFVGVVFAFPPQAGAVGMICACAAGIGPALRSDTGPARVAVLPQ